MDDEPINWREHLTDHWPDNTFLRNHGWRIKERPQDGPAIWEHPSGLEMTTQDAIGHVCRYLRSRGMLR